MDMMDTDRRGFCAIRMQLSPHEWTWTQKEQEEMARELLKVDAQVEDLLIAIDDMLRDDDPDMADSRFEKAKKTLDRIRAARPMK